MLSVLIVNWNTKELLRNCLASLEAHPATVGQEVIVVDNASSDGSADMVATEFPAVQLIASRANLGYAKGNNVAYRQAQGEWLLTLNPDTEVQEGTLDLAVATLAKKPSYGCLSVRFIGPAGETQKSVRGFPTLLGIFGALTRLDRFFAHSALDSYSLPRFDYETSQACEQPMGTFLLLRRSALHKSGAGQDLFDEQFPIFFNEVDLLARMKAAGFGCWYLAEASILHHHGASTKKVRKSMIWESHRSLVRYFLKHAGPGERLLVPLVALAAYTAAFLRAKGYDAGFRPDHHNM